MNVEQIHSKQKSPLRPRQCFYFLDSTTLSLMPGSIIFFLNEQVYHLPYAVYIYICRYIIHTNSHKAQ